MITTPIEDNIKNSENKEIKEEKDVFAIIRSSPLYIDSIPSFEDKRYNCKGNKKLSPKRQRLLENLLSGMNNADALEASGYSRTSLSTIFRLRNVVAYYQNLKQKKIEASVMSKIEVMDILKGIISTETDNRTRIQAIVVLNNMCGYQSLKTENVNSNTTILKMELDSKDNNGETRLITEPHQP
jgi:phage terminase small subunit